MKVLKLAIMFISLIKKYFFVSKCFNNSIIIGTGNNIIQTKLYIISIREDRVEIYEL